MELCVELQVLVATQVGVKSFFSLEELIYRRNKTDSKRPLFVIGFYLKRSVMSSLTMCYQDSLTECKQNGFKWTACWTARSIADACRPVHRAGIISEIDGRINIIIEVYWRFLLSDEWWARTGVGINFFWQSEGNGNWVNPSLTYVLQISAAWQMELLSPLKYSTS